MTTSSDQTLAQLAKELANGNTTSEALVTSALDSIERDQDLNIWLEVAPRDALVEQARLSDERRKQGKSLGQLDGIPLGIKDNINVVSFQTQCASRLLEGYRPPYDATVASKLRAQGAILIGKLNMDEFAMGSSTENSAYGPTLNPWDRERVPGGSSGGAAVSVASGMVLLALGSDTGGSVRQPASLCGVTGVKPSYGSVSRYGLVAYGSSLDQIGCLAKSSEDCSYALEVIQGHDPRDSTSSDQTLVGDGEDLELHGKRFCLPETYLDPEVVDAEVIEAISEAELMLLKDCLLYTSPSPRDQRGSRMPSSA